MVREVKIFEAWRDRKVLSLISFDLKGAYKEYRWRSSYKGLESEESQKSLCSGLLISALVGEPRSL